MLDAAAYVAAARRVPGGRQVGRVTRVVGLTVEVRGVTAPVGEICTIERGERPPLVTEIVGFRDGTTLLMPLGDADGLIPGAEVRPLHARLTVPCGEALLGRVVNG